MQSSVISEIADSIAIDTIVETARVERRSVMLEHEALQIVRSLGIATPDGLFIRSDRNLLVAAEKAWDSLWTDRVVVKVVSPEIIHKTDLGGVKIVEKRPAAIFDAMEQILERLHGFDIRGFLISEYVDYDASPGGELLVNLRWTPEFGPVVSVGLGGLSAEILGDHLEPGAEIAVFAPGSTTFGRIDSMLGEKAFTPLLTGVLRSKPPRLKIEELRRLIRKLLAMGSTSVPLPFDELEINPLVVGPHGLTALDAFVRIGTEHSSPVPRPLDKITSLLEPRSIAIVGVSRGTNPGRIILENLLREGFDADRIRVVKEGMAEIGGCRCVGSIEELPGAVDLIVLAIGAEDVAGAMEQIVEHRKAESVIVIPGGLGEREGTEGLEAAVRSIIETSRATEWRGPLVNGGNSLGIRSLAGNYDTMFLPHYKIEPSRRPGDGIAVISQSGAFAASVTTRLAPISPRTIISIGNQIDLTVGDTMTALADDPSIELFSFYVEGFRQGDGRSWLEGAVRAREAGKPVILYRAGRTSEGARATASHTAAMAGDAVVTRELARGAGAIVADSLEDLEDLIRTFWLLRNRTPEGLRIGGMSNAGFECVAMADSPGRFRFVPFSETTMEYLHQLFRENRLDSIMNVGNPLDVNPMMSDQAFGETVRAVLQDPGIDIGIIGCVPLTGALQTLPPGPEHDEDLSSEQSVATRLIQLWKHTRKPWVVVIDAGPKYDPFARRLLNGGIPTFRHVDRAMRVLSTWTSWKMQ